MFSVELLHHDDDKVDLARSWAELYINVYDCSKEFYLVVYSNHYDYYESVINDVFIL